ncbi:MAG: hypothetical protein EOP52_13995 [Sphingobacteriales bacterium]|nr:MAG: hypothetical protein EOP52_13995 [Sphingobacteriales bacterium]
MRGQLKFVLERELIQMRSARYGVEFSDVSTREDRNYWIAGSSLKVIDLERQLEMGERVGYMVDWAQGSKAGGRSPWLFAAENACPEFSADFPQIEKPVRHVNRLQFYQSKRFVQKILKSVQ